ncbi:hypothetical protein HPP92_002935 [Vanilla planifolia]|uniref:Uncharacterized protein n=1 Tax=Vanilla planifolia TaxID=51239 RepID=A0A835SFN4_VANPL|nr:hypothetical protein HPP92_003301 [Vanilla planifolia]KAG0502863.1 hypothetical protein HPP92_002935 [Vanilla planifolia]
METRDTWRAEAAALATGQAITVLQNLSKTKKGGRSGPMSNTDRFESDIQVMMILSRLKQFMHGPTCQGNHVSRLRILDSYDANQIELSYTSANE